MKRYNFDGDGYPVETENGIYVLSSDVIKLLKSSNLILRACLELPNVNDDFKKQIQYRIDNNQKWVE